MDSRTSPTPLAQRSASEGPIALAARPSRNSGARIKGVYDIPAGEYVHVFGSEQRPPRLVGSEGLFLGIGRRTYGTGSSPPPTAQFYKGATLWRLDAEDNPVPVHSVNTFTVSTDGQVSSENCYGDYLGGDPGAFVAMAGQPSGLALRYLPWGGGGTGSLTTFGVRGYAVRAGRVVGEAITQGPEFTFKLLTDTEPPGAVLFGLQTLADPNYIIGLTTPRIAGLSSNNALLIAEAGPVSAPGPLPWFVLYVFDPFDPQGTLQAPGLSIGRQPDIVITKASLGLRATTSSWSVTRRTATEAVMVVWTYDGGDPIANGQINVVRLSASGVVGNTVLDVATQRFSASPQVHPVAPGVVHAGDLRIDTGTDSLDLPSPFFSGFTSTTSPTLNMDDSRYLFINRTMTSPVEFTFTVRDSADSPLSLVTSHSDIDVEFFSTVSTVALAGLFGFVAESLWVSRRGPSSFNAREQVVTVELGANRQIGTAQVLAEQNRSHRLPQGQVT